MCGSVYYGDIEPTTSLTFDGIITAASWTNTIGVGVFKTTLTHTAIPYSNYIILAHPYSIETSSQSNDATIKNDIRATWFTKVSTTSTIFCFETIADAGAV